MASAAVPIKKGGNRVTIGAAGSVLQIPPRAFRGRLTGMLFDTDKTFLLPGAMKGIKGLKRFYEENPALKLLVVGHADTVGAAQYNVTLSNERARSIAAYLKDEVDFWMEFYAGRPGSSRWGSVEDAHMLAAVGAADVRTFQGDEGLTVDGSAGNDTRRRLVERYMALDGTQLPATAELQTHGCGEFHPDIPTADSTPLQENRRVEIFLFEDLIDPPPQNPCPAPGCAEYPVWVARSTRTIDFEQEPGALTVVVTNRATPPVPLAGAEVHASGPSPSDGRTDAKGVARFDLLIPGRYRVLAQKPGFQSNVADVDVPPGGAPAVVTPAADGGGTTSNFGEKDGGPGGAVGGPGGVFIQLAGDVADLIIEVVDARGRPVAGANVTIAENPGPAGSQTATTDAAGHAEFPGIPAADYDVDVQLAGFKPGQGTATVAPDQTNGTQITLQGDCEVGVIVNDGSGAPVDQADVELVEAGVVVASGQTSAGTFTFSDVIPGSYIVRASKTGLADAESSGFTIAAGSDSVTLVLAQVTVTIVPAAGPGSLPPLIFVNRDAVQLRADVTPAGGTFAWIVTGPAGVVRIDGRADQQTVSLKADALSTALGDVTVTVRYTSGGFADATHTLTALRVHLDVDADRDGTVEADSPRKNTWTFGPGSAGAVIMANCDDDGAPAGRDNENDAVDTAADVDELAPLVIRAPGPLPGGHKLRLTADKPDKVRIFDARAAGATRQIGPGATGPWDPPVGSADLDLSIEATAFPNGSFDGLVTLSLALLDGGGTEVKRDDVKVRVAPWMMPGHLEPSEQTFVVDLGAFNSTFRTQLGTALTAAGAPAATVVPTTLEPGVVPRLRDQWVQDCMEIGYTQTPGKTIPVVMNAPRGRGLQNFAELHLQGVDFGWTLPGAHENNTFNSSGNLEVTPPITASGKTWNFGRIYFGHGLGRSDGPINPDLRAFLVAQQVQSPVPLDTSWLAVGHVDEMMSWVPANSGKPFRLVLASPQRALAILDAARAAGNGGAKMCTGEVTEKTIDGFLGPAATPSAERIFNETVCQPALDAVRAIATSASGFGLVAADIVELPVLFHADSGGSADAFTADIANMLVVGTRCIMPDPFGPIVGATDLFKQEADTVLTGLGNSTSYVDDFRSYHLRQGEVHCGTNSRRRPPTAPWWEQSV